MATPHALKPDENTLAACEELARSDPRRAADRLRAFLDDHPLSADAYRLLAAVDEKVRQGGGAITVSIRTGEWALPRAAEALRVNDLELAEAIVRRRLLERPNDVTALRMLAELAMRLDFGSEAADLLRLAIEIAPDEGHALLDLAFILHRRKLDNEAIPILDDFLRTWPDDVRALKLKANALTGVARFEEAAAVYERLLQKSVDDAEAWTGYGFVLKTIGRRDDTIGAFRKAVSISPATAVAWWSLSDLKTVRFDEADIAAMQDALAQDPGASDQVYLHFALGKALEDRGDAEAAFAHYETGNRLRRQSVEYDGQELKAYVNSAVRTFTPVFFHGREDQGHEAPDPIFILGMTRAGSTLIEQILASHPDIEGTMELPDVPLLAKEISTPIGDYAKRLAQVSGEELERMGRAYIEKTREYRKTDRPFFIDKLPTNWMHVPLIHLMLPNARIIDARRHPLACCFSNFKQHFPRGQMFSYDLRELGEYYSAYVRLMAHIDEILPGRVHRVIHEKLVDDTEAEVRRLLDHLGLPFDEACLRFYETKRAVRTASAEQVRRPITREGVEQWRKFEPWLGPLKEALGPVLDCYPDVPKFDRPAD